jgi:hypothetical protein
MTAKTFHPVPRLERRGAGAEITGGGRLNDGGSGGAGLNCGGTFSGGKLLSMETT